MWRTSPTSFPLKSALITSTKYTFLYLLFYIYKSGIQNHIQIIPQVVYENHIQIIPKVVYKNHIQIIQNVVYENHNVKSLRIQYTTELEKTFIRENQRRNDKKIYSTLKLKLLLLNNSFVIGLHYYVIKFVKGSPPKM